MKKNNYLYNYNLLIFEGGELFYFNKFLSYLRNKNLFCNFFKNICKIFFFLRNNLI